MSANDDSTPPKSSVLRAFAPVPARAKQDKRLTASHHRCLLGLCDLMDKATGYCLASHRTLSKHVGLARQKIGNRLGDLESWGYIARVHRGRHSAGTRRGRFKTFLYRVVYDAADAGAMSPTGVTRVKAGTMSPTGVAETLSPTGVAETRILREKKEGATSIFRAVAEADRLDRVAEVARQTELPFAEVQYFDGLYQEATKRYSFRKIVKLDLSIRKQHRSPADYVRALTAKLEELVAQAPVDGEKHGPRKTGM